MEEKTISVVFSLAEFWLLSDFIRHEIPEREKWAYPPASKELNSEIALAIASCEDLGLDEYVLFLSEGDILVIDYNVRAAHKTPEGAKGKDILLKLYRARAKLEEASLGFKTNADTDDKTYKAAVKEKEVTDASASTSDTDSPDDNPDENTEP